MDPSPNPTSGSLCPPWLPPGNPPTHPQPSPRAGNRGAMLNRAPQPTLSRFKFSYKTRSSCNAPCLLMKHKTQVEVQQGMLDRGLCRIEVSYPPAHLIIFFHLSGPTKSKSPKGPTFFSMTMIGNKSHERQRGVKQ